MQKTISPASCITGSISLPGDKSISHRYAMLAAIAEGETRISNYSSGADCHSTLGCVRALGIEVEGSGAEFVIHGRGLDGLRQPAAGLDAGNSGSTIRMLSGILAAQPFRSRIFGDESLTRRPMQRIMKPLAQMGAQIQAARRQISSARNRRRPAAPHRVRAARAQRAGEDVRPVRRPLRRGRNRGHRAGTFARPHRDRSPRVRRRSYVSRADASPSRAGRGSPGATLVVPVRPLFGSLLSGRGADGPGFAPGHPRRGSEPHPLRAAGFSGGDGREDSHSRTREHQWRARPAKSK